MAGGELIGVANVQHKGGDRVDKVERFGGSDLQPAGGSGLGDEGGHSFGGGAVLGLGEGRQGQQQGDGDK